MAEFPSLPLYTDAYIADTQHLTNEEHGVYLRLLMFAWRSADCALPDDDKRLALMVGVTPKKWAALKPVVMAFWTKTDAGWQQDRLTITRRSVKELVSQRRAAGEASRKAKALKNNNVDPTSVTTEDPTGTPTKKEHPKPKPKPNVGIVDKSTTPTTLAGGFSDSDFDRLLRAVGYDPDGHIPEAWASGGMDRVKDWLSLGLDAGRIIDAAKKSRERHKELPATPQALNKVMDLEAARPAKEKPMTPEEMAKRLADMINGPGYCPPSIVTPVKARELLEGGLVTQATLRDRGIAV